MSLFFLGGGILSLSQRARGTNSSSRDFKRNLAPYIQVKTLICTKCKLKLRPKKEDLRFFEFRHKTLQGLLGITKNHRRVVFEKEGIFQARKP